MLWSRATELQVVDAALASRLHRGELESAVDAVPDDFSAYVAFLWKRQYSVRRSRIVS